jgi:pilus assembly protein CpaF
MPPPVPPSPLTGRLGTTALTPAEVRKRALARLAERIDFARSPHKPMSLLRQEARRVLDLFLDLEVPLWPKADRDKLAEDVVAEALGMGPLEELFRDAAVQEFMVLAHNQVIARKGDVWLPTSVHFPDPAQYRQALDKLAAQAEPVHPGPPPAGAIDARLPNGFRVVAVLPPAVLDQQPVAVFVRGSVPVPADAAGSSPGTTTPPTPTPAPTPTLMPVSGAERFAPGRGSEAVPVRTATRMTDPVLWARQKVTDRLLRKLAAAGVYDIGRLPAAELRKVVLALVVEFGDEEKLGLDAAARDRLALEILAGMQR